MKILEDSTIQTDSNYSGIFNFWIDLGSCTGSAHHNDCYVIKEPFHAAFRFIEDLNLDLVCEIQTPIRITIKPAITPMTCINGLIINSPYPPIIEAAMNRIPALTSRSPFLLGKMSLIIFIRSIEQNKLQRLWLNEAQEQGDNTSEWYRGWCKLQLGVAILINEHEQFAEQWQRLFGHLTWEQKHEMMMVPLDFPVTRIMSTKQKKKYLDHMYDHFTGLGFRLTEPL